MGLAEALDLSYRFGMAIWDQLTFLSPSWQFISITCWLKRGYIQQPASIYATLAVHFSECFFVDGQAPNSDFGPAIKARICETTSVFHRKRPRTRQVANNPANDPRKMLSTD